MRARCAVKCENNVRRDYGELQQAPQQQHRQHQREQRLLSQLPSSYHQDLRGFWSRGFFTSPDSSVPIVAPGRAIGLMPRRQRWRQGPLSCWYGVVLWRDDSDGTKVLCQWDKGRHMC